MIGGDICMDHDKEVEMLIILQGIQDELKAIRGGMPDKRNLLVAIIASGLVGKPDPEDIEETISPCLKVLSAFNIADMIIENHYEDHKKMTTV